MRKIIEINNVEYVFPKCMPIPRIGERVGINGLFGTVNNITYVYVDDNDCNVLITTSK